MTCTQSPFLDILPPELRLNVYEHLLVASTPIKGPIARQYASETYDLHTSILRTNKQIHSEARHAFLGKNIFCVNSVPSLTGEDDQEGSGAFEPPLQLKDLPLVRHLRIDLLYYPAELRTSPLLSGQQDGWNWQPICPGAQRYATSLSFLLSSVKYSLLSLTLGADIRPYLSWPITVAPLSSSSSTAAAAPRTDDAEDVEPKKFLTGFYMVDRNRRFGDSLAALDVRTVTLRFDFPEAFFDFEAKRELVLMDRLVHLAGQVLSARSEMHLRVAFSDDNDGEEVESGTSAQITLPWPCLGAGEEVVRMYGIE
ncbi:hypothetical protein GQ44DRAFT_700498 [Phaeosphaeriaceae sp. PMI808]|nr:hypothetical protein GQ44DRAFT_700498 [Phaeosphaeriaceae sp. PMI808]